MSTGTPSTSGQDAERALHAPGEQARDVREDLRVFFQQLLDEQLAATGAAAGVVYVGASEARAPGTAAQRARDTETETRFLDRPGVARLERAAQRALEQDGGVSRSTERVEATGADYYGSFEEVTLVAAPLAAAGRVEGVAALLFETPPENDAIDRLATAASRFEAFLWERQCLAEAQQKQMLRETLEVLDAGQRATTAAAMAAVLGRELQRRFGATRVSFGLESPRGVRVLSIGDSDRPDRKSADAVAIARAMDECLAQNAEIVYPPPAELERDPMGRRVTRAHEALASAGSPSAALSLPLRYEGDAAGVVTLERDAHHPFPPGAVILLRLMAEYAGPAIITRKLADRGLWGVLLGAMGGLGRRIVGPRHTATKLVLLTILIVLIAAALVPIPARIAAPGEVHADVSRTLAPPFAGYILDVQAEVGDAVEIGDTLVVMDTSELLLRIAELEGRRLTATTDRDDAQAARELARARLAEASIRELDAQLTLLRDRVARSEIAAPISGVVARGNLRQLVGALVEPDRALMEIVTNDRRVDLRLSERDALRVQPGDRATFTPRADPSRAYTLVIERVHPAARVEQGGNVYTAEAVFESHTDLPPGATGTVRIADGTTTGLRWLLTPLIDEARLRLWW